MAGRHYGVEVALTLWDCKYQVQKDSENLFSFVLDQNMTHISEVIGALNIIEKLSNRISENLMLKLILISG